MRAITIINQKGGCGKTTTSINLAGIFAKLGLRTLLVDMDPQSHCAAGLAIPEQRIDLDIGDAMLAADPATVDVSRLLWRVSRNLDLAPSRMRVAGLEASRGGLAERPDKERRLSAFLDTVASRYDIACIDCSPAIGLLAFNAITAASEIIIPVETSYFSLQGATKQINTVRSIERRLGARAPAWLLATMHDESSALARDLLSELRRRFGNRVIPVVINMDPALREAASFGQPVVEYAPQSSATQQYQALAKWLLERSGIEIDSLSEEGLAGMTPDIRILTHGLGDSVPAQASPRETAADGGLGTPGSGDVWEPHDAPPPSRESSPEAQASSSMFDRVMSSESSERTSAGVSGVGSLGRPGIGGFDRSTVAGELDASRPSLGQPPP